jgi:phage shock protein E
MRMLTKLSVVGALLLVFAGTSPAREPAPEAVWIDVRTLSEFDAGHLEGAHHIPFDAIEKGVARLELDRATPIYLYCAVGGRAERAKHSLERIGFTAVTNVGGLEDARQLVATGGAPKP